MAELNRTSLPGAITRRVGLAALVATAIAVVGIAGPSRALAEDRSRSRSASSAARTRTSGASSSREAAKKGLTIETVVFNDYTQPNEALERGEIDANAFQHQPYLDNQIKQHGYHIVASAIPGSGRSASTPRSTRPSPTCRKVP